MTPEPPLPTHLRWTTLLRQPLVWGSLCGLVAAFGYTAANIFLRNVTQCDPIWVSCIKSVPTVLAAGLWLSWKRLRKETDWPARSILGPLILAGLIVQLFGNVAFQWALGVVGIALTVPLVMGTILIAGAILGRIYLHEAVTWRSICSMAVLIVAICILSLGTREAFGSVTGNIDNLTAANVWILVLAVAATGVAGFAYAALGVVIRFGVSGRASVMTTIFIVSLVGMTSLGLWSFGRLGIEGMLATRADEWRDMWLAGICNFVAFLALTRALQLTTVVYVNTINVSQVAMAAVAGVLLFQEAPSWAMWIGVGLTALGLLMMSSGREQRSE